MSRVTKIEQPLRRRIGKLVIEITAQGIRMRGYRCRKWHAVTWLQIAALDNADNPQDTVGAASDRQIGLRRLREMRAVPTERSL
ncbi:hypothetical protein [Bremerella cremea]|uniref:hypothetical protein n=1 Tax=Bremerella cremea TaxID=1031537 RepID=UPI0031ED3774